MTLPRAGLRANRQLDRRARETLAELVEAIGRRAALRTRARNTKKTSFEYLAAAEELQQLSLDIDQLERALAERPWTEAAS